MKFFLLVIFLLIFVILCLGCNLIIHNQFLFFWEILIDLIKQSGTSLVAQNKIFLYFFNDSIKFLSLGIKFFEYFQ